MKYVTFLAMIFAISSANAADVTSDVVNAATHGLTVVGVESTDSEKADPVRDNPDCTIKILHQRPTAAIPGKGELEILMELPDGRVAAASCPATGHASAEDRKNWENLFMTITPQISATFKKQE